MLFRRTVYFTYHICLFKGAGKMITKKMSTKQKLCSIVLVSAAMILLFVRIVDAGPFVYITNLDSNNVSVINTATYTVIATVNVGINPVGVAVTAAGTKVYVVNDDSNNVSVIDTATNNVTATVPVGIYPVGVVVTPDGTKAYVANVGSNNVSVINTATNIATASVSVGNYPYELQSLQLGQMYLWQTVIAILSL